MPQIFLASQSPRRRELLAQMGLTDFATVKSDCDERYPTELSPHETVEYISRKKAAAVASLVPSDAVLIAADTMVFLGDERLGKPKDADDALRMLTALAGTAHTVCTGVTLRQGDQAETFSVSTAVHFRACTEQELRAYIATGEPMDKAGAYGIQGLGALLVERIEGDYCNVVGLPVEALGIALGHFGIHLL